MRLEAVYFKGQYAIRYQAMAAALALSAHENSPHTPLMITEVIEDDAELRAIARKNAARQWLDNARKSKHHFEIIRNSEDGEVLGMLDIDTMVLGDLSEIESMDFDIAYCERPAGSAWKINTGVYFVRTSRRVRRFVGHWNAVVQQMLADGSFHAEWKTNRRFGGIHQAALGYMLEGWKESKNRSDIEGAFRPIKFLTLPCETWNCVNGCWATAENPKIVHLLGDMQEWCFGHRKPENANELKLVQTWQAYDKRAQAENRLPHLTAH